MCRQELIQDYIWLNQIHSSEVIYLPKESFLETTPSIDGIVTDTKDSFLTILTADCLPVLFSDSSGEVIAACHAGWRGLVGGILQNTLKEMVSIVRPDSKTSFYEGIHVYIGPAIGQKNYEVGVELKNLFTNKLQLTKLQSEQFFHSTQKHEKCLADLFGLAIHVLQSLRVSHIYTEKFCTFELEEYFYSYRKNKTTGRFASCIWID